MKITKSLRATTSGSGLATESTLIQVRDNLADIEGFTDGLEGLATASNALLTTIRDNADQLEGFTDGIEGLLTTIRDNADTVETLLTAIRDYLKSDTGSVTAITASTIAQTVLAANAARRGFFLYNDSNKDALVKFASTPSASSFTFKIGPGGFYERELTNYTGIVTVIWASVSAGTLYATELT